MPKRRKNPTEDSIQKIVLDSSFGYVFELLDELAAAMAEAIYLDYGEEQKAVQLNTLAIKIQALAQFARRKGL